MFIKLRRQIRSVTRFVPIAELVFMTLLSVLMLVHVVRENVHMRKCQKQDMREDLILLKHSIVTVKKGIEKTSMYTFVATGKQILLVSVTTLEKSGNMNPNAFF